MTRYVPGTVVTASDYEPEPHCGHGLHFWPTPATLYGPANPIILRCEVPLASLIPIGDKCKAQSCTVLNLPPVEAQ